MNNIRVERYHASFCQPCKVIAPIIEDLKNKYMPKGVAFRDFDIETHSDVTEANRIMSVPTVLVFRNGTEYARIMGVNSPATYENAIKTALEV